MPVIRAALAYFALVFGAGFALGTIRVPFLVPAVGARLAELIEMPLLLLVIAIVARWLEGRFGARMSPVAWLAAGALAAVGVLAADLGVGIGLRGMTAWQVFFERDPVSGTAYYLLVALCALMPWIIATWRRAR
jgi:hypothetical protein